MEDKTTKKVTFESDPLKYCQEIYREAVERNDDLRDVNVENRLFYEGIDSELEARANDPNVKRSSIFIPLLKPAIDTRVADPVSRVDDRECPITVKPRDPNAEKGDKEQVAKNEYELNTQFRECGYLSNGFREHILGAEIYRLSAVKVGWEKTYEKKAERKVYMKKVLGMLILPATRVEFKTIESGRPYVEWLYPDEFLYQPNVSRFEDSEYVIHRMWKTEAQLLRMAEDLGYDEKLVKRAIEEAPDDSYDGPKSNDSMRDQIEQEKDTPFEDGYKDDKILVCEFYIPTMDGKNERVKRVTVVSNAHIVKTEDSYKGIRFPFVPITANRLPGTVEGLSSVDIGRNHQRLYNELVNTHIDGLTYRMFPVTLRRTGNKFTKPPVIGLGRQWELPDISPDGIRPLVENPGQAPDLIRTMQIVSDNLRNALNSPDSAQGFNAQPYEKATSSKLRAMGSERRSAPTNKQYGLAVIEIAKMFIALNQEFADDAKNWVIDVMVDVPSLTNITDPEGEKQDWILLESNAAQNPLYQSPAGLRKLRNMHEEMLRKFIKTGVDRYVVTEQELDMVIGDQARMEQLMSAKQSLAEQMAMEQGQMQQAAPQSTGGQSAPTQASPVG